MKNPIASGLQGPGKAASWVIAFAAVGAYTYYSNNKTTFSGGDQDA